MRNHPYLMEQDCHERCVEDQSGQTPPCRYLYRRRMEMARRKLAMVEQAQVLFHLAFAALTDACDRVACGQSERLAPDLQPVHSAALIFIYESDSTRSLDLEHRDGRRNQHQ